MLTPRFSPDFYRLLWRVLVALAVFHAAYLFLFWFPDNWMRDDRLRDLMIYYDAGMRLRHGQPIYQPWPEYRLTDIPSRFFYPPPFLLIVRPLVELNYLWFGRAWSCLLMAAFWVYAGCLTKIATGKIEWRPLLVAGMTVGIFPRGHFALGFGNFEPVIWACYGIALATRFRAAPLAFAAMVKLHPIWALMLVIKREGRRAALSAAAVFAVGVAGGIWLCGWPSFLEWWPASSTVVSQGALVPDNVSLSFLPLRALFASGALSTADPLPTWARLYLSVMALGAPLTAMYLTRRQTDEMRYALIACAAILFAPLCWSLYLPLLLLPMAIWWGKRRLKWQSGQAAPQASACADEQPLSVANKS